MPIHSIVRPLIFLSILTASLPAMGQDALELDRLNGPIVLDGRIDEAAWREVRPLDVVMYAPVHEGRMTEDTEIRVAYDDGYLYMAARLFDADPNGIRSNSLYRDRYSGDDTVALILDTFNDNENALWFFTTPAGVRFDMAVTGDAEGRGPGFGGAVNNSWNTFWDVATARFDGGWTAEMRLPYSSLGFQEVDGRVEMGLIAYRYIARKGERHIYPSIPPNWSMGFAKPSQARTVVLRGVTSQKPIYVTPYVTGGVGRAADLNEAGTKWITDVDPNRDAGIDLKYSVTNNLTLDATVNTDFAQVEADDQQVNLSRFSQFFPEKRQFFQERAGIFSFSTGRRDRLFHSRKIGLHQGQEVRILGGGRLVGRVGEWDVGALNMQTEADAGLPSENFGVVRLRRRVINDQSYAGSMLTSRLGADGSYNVAYGLDGIIRLAPDGYLDVKWAQSIEQTVVDEGRFDFADAGLLYVEYERRGTLGWTYDGGVTYAGALYDPGIGFVTRRDFLQLSADVQYGWLRPDESRYRTYDASIFGHVYFRNEDGSVESASLGHSWDFAYKSSADARLSANLEVEDLPEDLSLPEDMSVPAGRYTFAGAQGRYTLPAGDLIRGGFSVGGGTFYDGWRIEAGLDPTWSVSRFIELAGSYEYTRIGFPDRDQSANIHLLGVRSRIALNTQVSLSTFVQYNTAAEVAIANLRFRYNFGEGNDLWVVYNDNLNTHRERFDPVLPVSQSRTLLFKYTYTFAL
ncbi:MAG: carbohydrate binding family 9 domain-containing protein [Rhodothermales bacterium]|nr:carbohydrate binding family 9 domain-containing protein [Rhodothermales bacterium]